jgi:hypothetical protein
VFSFIAGLFNFALFLLEAKDFQHLASYFSLQVFWPHPHIICLPFIPIWAKVLSCLSCLYYFVQFTFSECSTQLMLSKNLDYLKLISSKLIHSGLILKDFDLIRSYIVLKKLRNSFKDSILFFDRKIFSLKCNKIDSGCFSFILINLLWIWPLHCSICLIMFALKTILFFS